MNPFSMLIIRMSALCIGVADCSYSLILSCAFFCGVMPNSIDALPDLISLASMGGIGVMGAQLCIVIYLLNGAKWAYNAHWIGVALSVSISICAFRLDIELNNNESLKNSSSYGMRDEKRQRIIAEIERLTAKKKNDVDGYDADNKRTKGRQVTEWYDAKIAKQELELVKLQNELEQKEKIDDISAENTSSEQILSLIAGEAVAALRLNETYEADIKRILMYSQIVIKAGLIDLTGPRLIAFGLGLDAVSSVEIKKFVTIKSVIRKIVSIPLGWIAAIVSILFPRQLVRRKTSMSAVGHGRSVNASVPHVSDLEKEGISQVDAGLNAAGSTVDHGGSVNHSASLGSAPEKEEFSQVNAGRNVAVSTMGHGGCVNEPVPSGSAPEKGESDQVNAGLNAAVSTMGHGGSVNVSVPSGSAPEKGESGQVDAGINASGSTMGHEGSVNAPVPPGSAPEKERSSHADAGCNDAPYVVNGDSKYLKAFLAGGNATKAASVLNPGSRAGSSKIKKINRAVQEFVGDNADNIAANESGLLIQAFLKHGSAASAVKALSSGKMPRVLVNKTNNALQKFLQENKSKFS